jgi:hypothetical protein
MGPTRAVVGPAADPPTGLSTTPTGCAVALAAPPALQWRMSDPIPGCDPSEAYDVVPLDPIRKDRDPHGWWACLRNGIVVRIASQRAPLARYASDPEYRASLITNKLWEKHAGR